MECKYEKGIITPSYVFDLDVLEERMRGLRNRIPENMELCYAIKANPFLITPIDCLVEHFEVCSPGELDICKKLCVKPEKIVFSGVNKRKEEIQNAAEYGVDVITLESLQQYRYVQEVVKERNISVKILPRLSSGAQFGMDASDIERIVMECAKNPKVAVIGIHYFTGTQKKKTEKILEEAEFLLTYAKKMKEVYGFSAEVLEFGAGLPVPYFEGDDFENEMAPFETLCRFIDTRGKEFKWTLELGRFMCASCGSYVTKVVETKCNAGKNFCIVDGGINHVNYYGQNMAMRVPVIEHRVQDADEEKEEKEWTICGSLCTFADILVRKKKFINLKEQDMLVFKNIGAYSVTEGIYLFLSRRMPSVYFNSKKKGFELVRKPLDTSLLNSEMR